MNLNDTMIQLPEQSQANRFRAWLGTWRNKWHELGEQRKLKKAVLKGPRLKFDIDDKRLKTEAGSPEQQAAIDGAQGLPPAASVLPSKYEQDLLELIEQEGELLREKLGITVGHFESRFSAAEIEDKPLSLQSIRRLCHETERPRIIEEEKRILQPLKERENQANCDLVLFRTQNGLTRPEESADKWFGSALLIIIVVVEAAVNGYLLKDSQSAGFQGAIIVSILFSLVNVSFAFVIGSILGKNTLHVKVYRRVLAWLGLILALPCTLILNGWFAALRTQAEQGHDLSKASDIASGQVINNPLLLFLEPGNLWMIALGMVFTILAFYKGMHFSDPYPGYSQVTHRARESAAALQEAIDLARQRLIGEYQQAEDDMKAIVRGNDQVLLGFQADMRQYTSLAETYNHALAKLNNVLQTSIYSYRTENLRHRGDTPPPRYFQSPAKLSLSPTAFNDRQLQNLFLTLKNIADHFKNTVLSEELRYLNELRLFAIAQLDAEVLRVLGEPVSELPSLPPLRPESTAFLTIQPNKGKSDTDNE